MKDDGFFPNDSQPFTVYHLTDKWNGGTVSKVLKELLVGGTHDSTSWGQVRKFIANRHVEINGNLCLDEARRVRNGDVLRLWKQPRPMPIRAEDVRIVYSDEHLCVVEKPPGVTSVRHARENSLSSLRRQIQPTLDELVEQILVRQQSALKQHRSSQPNKGTPRQGRFGRARRENSAPQVFAVHRLDHHTSGLMLFARTRECQNKLIAMFRRHQVQREYVGVCHGVLQPQTIRSYLIRDRGDGLRGSLTAEPTARQAELAQEAITHVVGTKPIGQSSFCLFRCRLETGRTHQIRIHLAEIGHRLCGEKLYVFDSSGTRFEDLSQAPRQALHSDRLALVHPITSEPLEFAMPWPKDLAVWIRSLSE